MQTPAIYQRVLQFRAGPQHFTFEACAQHRADLERGAVDHFFATDREPVRPVDPEDERDCYFCREG